MTLIVVWFNPVLHPVNMASAWISFSIKISLQLRYFFLRACLHSL